MLHVDLKTIHNWVDAGHLVGRRTQGRHLRFARPVVAHFMRRFGYPIPPAMARFPAAVLFVSTKTPRLGSRGWIHVQDLYAASLRLGGDAFEVAAVELDGFGVDAVRDWVTAVRSFELSADVALVGMSDKPLRRRGYLAVGGDVAVPGAGPAAVDKIATWLVGASESLPRNIELPEDE
jgi:hypothetical protein